MEEKKKAVWITGASSGIGKAITEFFIMNGISVVATSRRLDVLQQLKESLKIHGELSIHELDVRNREEVANFYSAISKEYEIECLINNAGITSFKKAANDSIEDVEQIINTNLLGSIYTIKEVLPDMIERSGGTIITVLSVAAKKIFTLSSAYSASKAGLQAYTNVLREEVRDKNIRVINISPGPTNTNIWSASAREKYSEKMMDAESIASLVLKVYSEKSNMVAEDIVVRPITGDL